MQTILIIYSHSSCPTINLPPNFMSCLYGHIYDWLFLCATVMTRQKETFHGTLLLFHLLHLPATLLRCPLSLEEMELTKLSHPWLNNYCGLFLYYVWWCLIFLFLIKPMNLSPPP